MYCGKYGQNITDRRICRVVNQMVHAGLVPAEMWKPGDKDEYVTVYAFLKSGTLRLALGAWKESVPSAALAELGSSQSLWCWVAGRRSEERSVGRGGGSTCNI